MKWYNFYFSLNFVFRSLPPYLCVRPLPVWYCIVTVSSCRWDHHVKIRQDGVPQKVRSIFYSRGNTLFVYSGPIKG